MGNLMEFSGAYEIRINGRIVERKSNQITASMMDPIGDLIGTPSSSAITTLYPTAIAIGTGTAAPAITDTALANQTASFSVSAVSRSAERSSPITIVASAYVPSGNAYNFQEIGVFASARMLSRSVLSGPISKAIDDDLSITWTLTVRY